MPVQTSLSDAELVIKAQAGDHNAVGQIYERYASPIYRYIYFRVNDAELAEDLQGEVFLRMVEGLPQYEDRGWQLSAWLYRIARDRIIDTIRRQKFRRQVPLDTSEIACDGPETSFDARLDRETLNRMLHDLTEDQRQVIYLRFMADLSIQEVADKLGRSETSVKALQHRGIQTLARRIEKYKPVLSA